MHRLRAVAVLLLVAAAWAPLGTAGTAEDPELSDAAGDQTRTRPGSQVPVPIPGVNDAPFNDIDIVSAWFDQPPAHDCVGLPPLTCPTIDLVVATTSGWTTGTLTAAFKLETGPTSYADSNATGQEFLVTVQGTTVTGLANATALVAADGLRIRLPIPRLNAVGGDLLTGLNLTTTRTDRGSVTDPAVTQDDQTGSDAAGPGDPYTMFRPPVAAGVDVSIARIGNKTGNALTVNERGTYGVQLRISNLGTDDDAYSIAITSDPPLENPPALAAVQTPLSQGEATSPTIAISLAGMEAGTIRVKFTVTTARGATDDAVAIFALENLPVAERAVVPAGLDFLSPAAESLGLAKAFGSYAELVVLALLVLIVILAIFLLVAIAPSTLAGAGEPVAPPVKGGNAAPAGVLPVVTADEDADDTATPPPEATVGGALKIESVTHTPDAPEEGEAVSTEVILRNPGPTRKVRVVLAVDEHDDDEAAVTLPARATKTVRLSWTAGPGENLVRVRVLPASGQP